MTIIIILIILGAGLAGTLVTCTCIMSAHISREDKYDDNNDFNVW